MAGQTWIDTARLVDATLPRLFRGGRMRKNRVLIIDHDLQTCKDIKHNLKSEMTEAYYTLTSGKGWPRWRNRTMKS